MADWMGDVSDSDVTDSEVPTSDVDEESSESDENEGFNIWRKKGGDDDGDDDDEDDGTTLRTNKDKALLAVCDACDKFDFVDFDDPESWRESIDFFNAVVEALDKYMNKYADLPQAFAMLMETLESEIEAHKDLKDATADDLVADASSGSGSGSDDGSDDEDVSRAELRAKVAARKFYVRFAKKVEQKRQQYTAQIQRVLEGDDEEAEEGVEGDDSEPKEVLTRERMEEFLINAPTDKGDIKMCRRILTKSRLMGAKPLEVAAAAHLCTCLLENAPSTGPSSSVWRDAQRALMLSITQAEESKLSISEGGTKFSDSLASIKNGWGAIAVSLHNALVKAMQNSTYTPDAARIKDEALAASALDRALAYYVAIGQKRGIGRCAAALLDILSVRTPQAHELLRGLAPQALVLKESSSDAVAKLAAMVDGNVTDADAKVAAKLAHIYSIALHDRFYEARDALLAANIQLDPMETEDTLLVRYNRAVAQLGLCAFRVGLFGDCLQLLGDLCSKNPRELRELLGQTDLLRTQRRFGDEDVEKTARDRVRMVPPHHAMPVQLLEHGHLVLSMANDIIVEAKNPDERPQRSKQFFSLCKRNQNPVFRGPPNEDSELIYAAYEALQDGAMAKAIGYVRRITTWKMLPEGSNTLALLEAKLRQDGLKVFLISRGQHYASLTVDDLVARFGLAADEVKAIVSRLLLDNTLTGHWDHDDRHVVIERGPQSRFHLLARECSDRIASFATYNENPNAPAGREGRGGRGGYSWSGGGGGFRGRGRGRGGN
uniref:EIF3c n=1 Tax=Neobodo designis TaxID=312471 RepID=A0A7S1PX18_NEODS|eukprot:CAMPEP_0174829408 /NCGR_PEP_ID=MMETSP1114-20130205/1912_1 /TAXON_ID=312471 /ORGANISM="Neobodo designis, Strain CCAP 1951/1" /LENGTH=774 /DNA_ID=CAMNT_0016063155 /DNA_START=111 /DNA_END=2435 /DNA_ORIENTATION=-